jgi:hypothetical protein
MGFEIDELAFRRQNQGRPLGHLVRELIQNVFDEDARFCHVRVEDAPGGLLVEVADGARRGIRRIEEVFTIFASGKRDDPSKRGRLGRGLKEMVSVCDRAAIVTVGKTVTFDWRPGERLFVREIAQNDVATGTTVSCALGYGASKRKEITAALRLFIPPEGVRYTVNGEEVARPKLHKTLRAGLRTVVFDEAGTQKELERRTDVLLWEPNPGDRPHVYEMGIPVEALQREDDFPWHVDVGQRVPLKAERDRVSRSYMRSLWAQILNQTVADLRQADTATTWVDEATAHPQFDREGAGKVLVERRFGDRVARASNTDDNVRAEQGLGYRVVHTQSLSDGMREILRLHTPSTTDVVHPKNFASLDDWLKQSHEVEIPEGDQTAEERDFVAFGLRLADVLFLPIKRIVITSQEAPPHIAHFTKRSNLVCVCRQGVRCVPGGGDFFGRARIHDWVDLLLHEFGHRKGDGHDPEWQNEVSRLAGAAFMAAPVLLEEFPLEKAASLRGT